MPIPSDEVLTGQCIGETFEALFAPLVSTGLEGEIEPLAHGLVTVLFRRREALSNALDKETRTLQGLIRCADGSEVLETQLEQSQDNIKRLKAVLDAIDQMAEAAASAYELQTSKAYIPPSGSRVATQSHLTGAVFEAKALLEAMLSDKNAQELAGAVIFGTSGIALNLGQKAEARDIKAIYVTQKTAP